MGAALVPACWAPQAHVREGHWGSQEAEAACGRFLSLI